MLLKIKKKKLTFAILSLSESSFLFLLAAALLGNAQKYTLVPIWLLQQNYHHIYKSKVFLNLESIRPYVKDSSGLYFRHVILIK